jgi:hypothetical protein
MQRTLPSIDPWTDLARRSHYDAAELRRRLGLSAEQFDSLGDALFGWPAQAWLDFIRVLDAAFLVWEGCSRSDIELALSISDGPGFWIWGDGFVDVTVLHAGQVIRIHRRACEDSRQGLGPVCGLVLPEGLEVPGLWMQGLQRLSAVCHPPTGRGADECPLAKSCLFAGECLHLRISLGVERAREALAGLLLNDKALRGRLEAQWSFADEHLIGEAVERAVLEYIDSPCRFDPNRGKTLPNFLLLIAKRRMANLERTERRHQQRLHTQSLAEGTLEGLLDILATAPSPAELLMTAEDDAEGEMTRARRRQLLGQFVQEQPPSDWPALELIIKGERQCAAYAQVLGIGSRAEPEQRKLANRAKHRLRRAMMRWMRMRRQRPPGGGRG